MMFFVWLACSTSSQLGEQAFSTQDRPQVPTYTTQEIESLINSLILKGIPQPLRVLELYEEFMSQRSSDCPRLENPNADDFMGVWDDNCSTAEGHHYFGTALYGADLISDEHIDIWIFNILCSFELSDPQGETFIGGGEIEYKRERTDLETTLEARINGSFSYPPAQDWLGEDSHASLFLSGNISNEQVTLDLYGGFNQAETSIFFDHLTLIEDTCGRTTVGRLSIRDPSFYWIHADFSSCEPCASLSWFNQNIGEICISDYLANALLEMAQATL